MIGKRETSSITFSHCHLYVLLQKCWNCVPLLFDVCDCVEDFAHNCQWLFNQCKLHSAIVKNEEDSVYCVDWLKVITVYCHCACMCLLAQSKKAFIGIRLHPSITTPFVVVAATCSLHVSPSGPLWPNVTSSAKPEVHNILQCRQRRTEPQGICTKFCEDRSSGSRYWTCLDP